MHLELADLALATHADGSSSALAPRDAALLAWLALEGPTPRSQLAELLWPLSDPVAARNTLRQRLFHLKRHCGELVAGVAALRLADGVEHDLADAEGVLGELQFPDAPALDAWLRGQRERRVNRLRRDLERQVRALEDAGELAAALAVAQALLRLDRLSEAAHRHVMRLHYLRGDRAAALLAFDDCERTLKDEVGTRPSAETMALLQTIEQALPHAWLQGQALPASALRPPQLIGRGPELAELAKAWAAQQLFIVTGQAGAGKSRLLDAMADTQPGVLVLRARPGDDKVPLATLDRLVHRLSERWPELGAVPAYARFIAQMSGPGKGQAPTVQSVAPILVDLLRAARAQGLVALVLDDLQFADDASVDIWQELVAWPTLAGLRFGFASRVDGDIAAARIAGLSRRSDAASVSLQPLGADAVQSFVESLALPLVDAPAVAAALVRRIGGNPLHLLETIRHALEKHGHLRADKLEAPTRVTDLLEQRLVALPADGLLVVRIAAVAGSDFDPELAAAVSRRDVLELADAWHALERQGLLDARGFMHDLIGEAAHRLLPQPIARVLHGRVAAHLAQHRASAARLAHHWLCAGDEAAAVPHLAAAARQAWQLGRSREMRDAYLRAAAIELVRGQPDAAFDLLFERAEAITELGPREAFDDAVERLAPLAHTPSQRARLAFMRVVSLHQRADHAGFLARLDDALALAIAGADRLIEAECRFSQGVYATHDGRLLESVQHLAAAAALHRDIGREQRALAIELNVHMVLLWTGQARLALDRQRDALQRVLDAGSPQMLAMLMMRQADSELHLGDVGAAVLTAGRALQALRATDMLGTELASTTRLIAEVQRRCGHWDVALDIVNETRQRLGSQPDPEQWLAAALAGIYLDLGRPDLAHRLIEAFAAASEYSVRQRARALALHWRYGLAIGAGIETARAVADALRAEHLLQACELVLAAGQAGEPELVSAQCSDLIARCEPQGLREELVALHALHARLLAREGDTVSAHASVALAEQALLQGDIGAVTPLAGLWLAQALRSLGCAADAALHAGRAAAWLTDRAQHAVPPEFRDSFLHRNPVHAALLAWAA
ncbi:ATP-binding protein [Piscinibacter sp.]|uniref:ATP-binding protein n=1 Tax=Piscinibacter sp. TaxID=1903157 RepID=UPI0035599717